MKAYDWNGLTLLPSRAVWRAQTRDLFVADVHLGKAAAFRAVGIAAPSGTTRENLARLDALIDALDPRRLIVLGDLFHARAAFAGPTLEEACAWRARRAGLAITLVTGNHDARAGRPPVALGLDLVPDPIEIDGLECRHHPLDAPGEGPPALAGHWHPVARLHGPGHDRLRLPCFHMRGRQLVLPAFGEFTGGARVEADRETALAAVAGDRLIAIPRLPSARLGMRR